mmetsp:Transcript_1311/g.1974  ORF Transcript_1311/g.1974 Transcript_1311/m.1974 type:complete len:226 (+) Transcript_1311:2932-3609(+)
MEEGDGANSDRVGVWGKKKASVVVGVGDGMEEKAYVGALMYDDDDDGDGGKGCREGVANNSVWVRVGVVVVVVDRTVFVGYVEDVLVEDRIALLGVGASIDIALVPDDVLVTNDGLVIDDVLVTDDVLMDDDVLEADDVLVDDGLLVDQRDLRVADKESTLVYVILSRVLEEGVIGSLKDVGEDLLLLEGVGLFLETTVPEVEAVRETDLRKVLAGDTSLRDGVL